MFVKLDDDGAVVGYCAGPKPIIAATDESDANWVPASDSTPEKIQEFLEGAPPEL